MVFSKEVFLSNMNVFFEQTGKKPAELEAIAGVSRGYISRLKLDSNTSVPGIDFILAAADMFSVSVEALSTVDFASVSETDEYFIRLLEKLIRTTEARDVLWEKMSFDDFKNKINNKGSHIDEMFDEETSATRAIKKVAQANWKYKSGFDYGRYRLAGIEGYLYEMKMDDKNNMYIVRTFLDQTNGDNYKEFQGVELFIVRERKEKINLCCLNPTEKHDYDSFISKLYNQVVDSEKSKTLDKKTKQLLDDFMSEN